MLRITEDLWIGNAVDGANLGALGVRALLNVAHDLRGWCGWPDVEYMQVGLVDGPGNPLAAYHAAVLALATLTGRSQEVAVCCHSGSRSLAVVLMYLNATSGRGLGCNWQSWLELLQERVEVELPYVHAAHRTAFDKMNWRSLVSVLGVQ